MLLGEYNHKSLVLPELFLQLLLPLQHSWLSSPTDGSSCPGDPFRKMALPFPSLYPVHSPPRQTTSHISTMRDTLIQDLTWSSWCLFTASYRICQKFQLKRGHHACSSPILYFLIPASSYSPADWHLKQMMIWELIVIITCKRTYRIHCTYGKAPDFPHRTPIHSERGVSRVLQWAHTP